MRFFRIDAVFASTRPAISFRFHSVNTKFAPMWVLRGSERDFSTLRLLLNSMVDAKIDSAFSSISYTFTREERGLEVLRRTAEGDSFAAKNTSELPKEGIDLDRRQFLSQGLGIDIGEIDQSSPSDLIAHYVYRPMRSKLATAVEPEGQARETINSWLSSRILRTEKALARIARSEKTLDRQNLKELCEILGPLDALYRGINEHYSHLRKDPGSLEFLIAKRERLQDRLQSLRGLEDGLELLETHSEFLLSPSEEAKIRQRIEANLKLCGLAEPPGPQALPAWTELIQCLGELKYAEQIINLASKLDHSFEAKIKEPLAQYEALLVQMDKEGGRVLALVQKIRRLFSESLPGGGEGEHVAKKLLKTLLRRSYERSFREELTVKLRELERTLNGLSKRFPESSAFATPSEKLVKLKESQKERFDALRARWQALTDMPLASGIGEFFRYGLTYFELIWYSQLLEENAKVRLQLERRLKLLAKSMQRVYGEELPATVEAVWEASKRHATMRKTLSDKLFSLEDHITKLAARHEQCREINYQLAQLKDQWDQNVERYKVPCLVIGSSEARKFLELGAELEALSSLLGQQNCPLFAPHHSGLGIVTWALGTMRQIDRDTVIARLPKGPIPYTTIVFVSDAEAYEALLRSGLGRIELQSEPAQISVEQVSSRNLTQNKSRGQRVADILNGVNT